MIVNNNIQTLVFKEAVPLPLPFLCTLFKKEFNEKWRKASMKYKIFTVIALLGSTLAMQIPAHLTTHSAKN